MHRKPLVLQQFPDLHVNVLTKIGDCHLRRRLQNQRNNSSEHSRERLRLGTHPPADWEVESYLRTTSRKGMHQKRARRRGHRITTDAQLLGQLLHVAECGGIQLD